MSQFQLFAVEEGGARPLPVPAGAASVADLYRGLPLGVYTALRTFGGDKFLYLDRHLARTRRSMALLGWEYALDEGRLRRALHGVVAATAANAAAGPDGGAPEMRVRIDVLAGPAEALGTPGRELIALQPFAPPPPALYERGVAVDFARDVRRANPLAKTADFAAARPVTGGLAQLERRETGDEIRKREEEAAAPYELLLLDGEGRILEGTGTNFWAVRDGVVYTAGDGVLEGITREVVLSLLPGLGVPLRFEAIGAADVGSLDEAALSGSSRAFLPVVEIAGQRVGDGRPGPISRRILAAYEAFVAENVRAAVGE